MKPEYVNADHPFSYMHNILKHAIAAAALSMASVSASHAESVYTIKDSAAYYMNLGRGEQTAGKYANAWKYFERAAKHDTRSAEAQMAIAEVCLKMNRIAPAVKALEAAVALNSSDYEAQWRLAQLYFNYGQFTKVIDMVPALRGKVADPKGWAFMVGKSYHSTQNYGKAIE